MPQELKQVNGRWVVTGDLRSSDLVPQAPAERIKPVAVKPKPSQGKPQKPWWAQLQNDVKYELNQLRKDPLSSLDRAANFAANHTVSGIALKQGLLGYFGAQDNFNRLGYSAVQRLQGRKKANHSAGRYGEYLDHKIDSTYRWLGATPPSQMSPAEREGDQFRRSIVGNVMAEGVTGKMQAAMQATTLLGRTLRGGAAFALNEALSTAFEDNTGGNPVNAFNMIPGVKLPGAVNVGQDDMLDAYLKSIVPNAATGLAVGAAAGGAVMAAQKVAGFRNIRRNIRAQRAVQREAQERAKQEAMGFLQKDEAGGHGFTPQAQQPPEPAAPITPQPTMAEETLAAVDALRQRIRGGAGEAAPEPGAAPRAAEPAPTQPAAAIPTAPMEVGGAVRNPDQPLPQADPAINYWDYDQSLPESTALGRSLSELSDREITTVLNNPGLPVVERVNQVMEARSAISAPPPLSAQLVMAPKGILADDYLEALSRTPSALTSREDYELRPLFDPEANPDLWRRAQAISGVDDPSQLSKADMLDTLRAMEGDGMVPIANRLMGAQMMPTGDIAAAPKVFQYKGGVDEQGQQLGNSLEGLERWDPAAEGIVQVWRDTTGEIGPVGQVYVVNGHNRLAAAKRMGIPSLRVEFLDAPTAAEARLAGAVANVSSGSGTVFDAAKLAREYGINTTADLKKLGKPQASGFWRDGIALSRLPEDVFQGAVNASDGQLKLYRLIGESGASPEIMRSAHIYITKNPKADAADLVEMIDYAKVNQAQNAAAQSGRQGVLEFEDWDSSYNEQMLAMNKLAVEVNSLLGKEKRLFRQTGKNANALESVANVDAAAATAVGNEAARAQQVFKDMKYVTGPINDLLKEGADRVMRGEAAGAVAQGIKNRMAAEVKKLMGEEVAPVTDVVQEDMFAAAGRAADAPPPAADLTPQQRLAAEAQLLHEGIAGGELRPPSTPLPELPEPARVRLDQVDLDQPVTPGSPTAQAIADEVRLAVEHKRMDAEMGWLQEQAGRDAANYHDLTFDQKQEIRNAVAGVPDVKIADIFEQSMRELAQSDARLYRSLGESLGNIKQGLDQLADAAPLDIPAAAGRKITAKTSEGRITSSAESLVAWTQPPGGDPMSLDRALALVRAKGALLDVEKVPGVDLDKALNDKSMGRTTPETEAVAAAYRQFYGVEAPRSAALAPAPIRPEAAMPPANSVAGKKVLKEISDLQEHIRFSRDVRLPAAKQNGNAEIAQGLEALIPKLEKQLADLQAKYGIEPAALAPATNSGADMAARVNSALASLERSIMELGGMSKADAQLLADFYVARPKDGGAGVAKLDPVTGQFTIKHGSLLDSDVLERALAKAKEWQGKTSALAPAPVRPEPVRLTEAAQQPEFLLSNDLSKSTPRYGRYTVAFESDLDRAAYVLANDAVKPSKAADKFRQLVKEAGLELDAVVAHGKRVKAALKQAAKGGAVGGQLDLPAQPWRGGGPMVSPQLFDDLKDLTKGQSLERLLLGDTQPAERERILKQLGNERLEGVWTLGQEGAANRLEQDILKFVRQMTGGANADIADAVFVRTNNAGYGGGGVPVPEQVGGVNADHIYNEDGAVLLISRFDEMLGEQGLDKMAEAGAHEAIHFLQSRRLTQKQLEALSSDEAVAYFRAEAGKARKWGSANELANIELMAWGSQRIIAARLLHDMAAVYRKQGLKKAAAYVEKVRETKLGEYVAPPKGVEAALEPLINLWERVKNYLLGAGFKRNADLTTEQVKIIADFTDQISEAGFNKLAKAIDSRPRSAAQPPDEVRKLLDAAYTGQIGKQMYLRPGRMKERAFANYEKRWDILGVSPSDYDAMRQSPPPTKAGIQRTQRQIDANNQAMDDIRRKAQQEGC